MRLIDIAHAAGTATGNLLDRLDTAPPIVLIIAGLIVLAFAILAMMWLLLPFAIYGLKKRLDEQTAAIDSVCGQLERMQMFFRNQEIPKLSLADDASELEFATERERGIVAGKRPEAEENSDQEFKEPGLPNRKL